MTLDVKKSKIEEVNKFQKKVSKTNSSKTKRKKASLPEVIDKLYSKGWIRQRHQVQGT